MARTIPSHANPGMLKWARERAGYSLDEVARAERVAPERVMQWESGGDSPSLARLRKLSQRYKRPMMVFYLPEPPQDFTVVKDFRRIANGGTLQSGPAMRYAIRFAQQRQAWAAEYLAEDGATKVDFIGTVKSSDDPIRIAAALRKRLGLTLPEQRLFRDASAGFREWRRRCEDMGVFVFQSERVPVEQMRGCALTDEYAPVVLINGSDFPTARTFTLIHEVTHLLLGDSAVSGYDSPFVPQAPVERFCNRVAAETIVPGDDLRRRVPKDWRASEDRILSACSRVYKISRIVIALRLVELGLADQDWLKTKWPELQPAPKPQREDKFGPTQQNLALSRSGPAFAKLAVSAFNAGSIHGGELSSLLGMKLGFLNRLESSLLPRK